MKKFIIPAVCVIGIIAAFAVFFAMQTTPKNVLNPVRAQNLEIRDGVITVPEVYTLIETEAFAGKTDFNKVVVQGEAQICERAFYGCPNLRSVILEKKCEVGSMAFADCPALESVSVNSGEGSCAGDAFDGHGGLVIYCRENSEVIDVARRSDISYRVIE